jgi:hypothetical protein
MNTSYIKTKDLPPDVIIALNDWGHEYDPNALWVKTTDLELSQLNEELFSMDDIPELAEMLKVNGLLRDPLYVWGGSTEVMSGNRRLSACQQIATSYKRRRNRHKPHEFEYLPIREGVKKPKNRSEEIEILTRYNDGVRKLEFADRYRIVEELFRSLVDEGKFNGTEIFQYERSYPVDVNKLLSGRGVHPKHWRMMQELKEHQLADYELVRSGVEGVELTYNRATWKPIQMRMGKNLLELLPFDDQAKQNFIDTVYSSMQVFKLKTGILYRPPNPYHRPMHKHILFNVFEHMDRNVLSSTFHAIANAWLAAYCNSIGDLAGDYYVTTDQNKYHDVYSPIDDTGVETKTRIASMTETPSFEPDNFKEGVHFLVTTDHGLNSLYAGLGILTKEDVKLIGGGRTGIINERFEELKKVGKYTDVIGSTYLGKAGKLEFIRSPIEPVRKRRFKKLPRDFPYGRS